MLRESQLKSESPYEDYYVPYQEIPGVSTRFPYKPRDEEDSEEEEPE